MTGVMRKASVLASHLESYDIKTLVIIAEAAEVNHGERQHRESSVAPQRHVEFGSVNKIFDERGLMPCVENILHALFKLFDVVHNGFRGDAVGAMFRGGLHHRRETFPVTALGGGVSFGDGGGDVVLDEMFFGEGFIGGDIECGGIRAGVGETERLEDGRDLS